MKSTAALSLCNLLGLGLAARIPLTRNTTPNFSDRNFNINTDNLPTALVRRTCGETAALICYGVNRQGTSQNLDVDNITYAAGYLRYLADTAGDSLLWTMPPEFDYSEWSLPVFGPGTVLALAKHINPCTNSSVTYYDLARGCVAVGECGANDGEVAVTVDAADPAYATPEYVASGAKPQDIIVKLVRDPTSLKGYEREQVESVRSPATGATTTPPFLPRRSAAHQQKSLRLPLLVCLLVEVGKLALQHRQLAVLVYLGAGVRVVVLSVLVVPLVLPVLQVVEVDGYGGDRGSVKAACEAGCQICLPPSSSLQYGSSKSGFPSLSLI
ncbi:hypothetical protein F4821DRAFT_255362 [Hypoxylon rubiginosum]|uniref:Uncharacterized protein n=1 Tax=Hypoxylon rubiginosum TaxID=110542 RepID=A0ACC0DEC3_9PEZI|nr:hypothetical protein F4821DRAFT_255362 [Hypoxylon rubiginosum]